MFIHSLTLPILIVSLILGALVIHWWMRPASSTLHPRARAYALSLTIDIYHFLCNEREQSGFLLALKPSPREQVALAEVVAEVARCVAEAQPHRVKELSQAWGLEEALTQRITHKCGAKRTKALHTLLLLHPSQVCVENLARHHYNAPDHALAQLLLVLYTRPSQVEMLLARHSHELAWEEVQRIVEVLKMHSPILPQPTEWEEGGCYNLALFHLYLVAIEGVGDARQVAERLTTSTHKTIRTIAFNVLLREAMYPTLKTNEIGS